MADRATEAAQDPAELFDIVNADRSPTGITKPRAAVHRDGDWHRSIHVWVAGVDGDGDPYLVFQRRSLAKDTWPGRLDATVGGHFRAGESLDETLRETEEEIGLSVSRSELRWLGTRVCANEAERGLVDRELQEVFLYETNRPLLSFKCHPTELAGLVKIKIRDVLALFAGELEQVSAEWAATDSSTVELIEVVPEDFIPNVDRYFYRIAIAAQMALRGEPHAAV